MDKILLVEDEQYIREFISLNLTRNDFIPLEADSGEKAIALLEANNVDLVLLDLKLPGIDGYTVCREIRNRYPGIAIIMVTAKSQDMDKVMGLELGADDYMTKPFNPYELIARIRSVLRRTKVDKNVEKGKVTEGRVSIDHNGRKFYKDGIEIKLTPKEFDLVCLFIENGGTVYTRDQLLDSVWGKNYFGDTKTLDVHIRRLRNKIEDNPDEPIFIETIWGYGYRWREV